MAKRKQNKYLGWLFPILFLLIFISPIIFSSLNKKQIAYQAPTSSVQKSNEWKTYSNPSYGISFKYPASLYFFNCPNPYEPGSFRIYLTDEKKNDCNMPGKGKMLTISINNSSENDHDRLIAHINNPITTYITVDGKQAKRITGSYEEVGDQGEVILSHPIRSEDLVFINLDNNKSITLNYQRISHIEKSDSKMDSYFTAKKDITPTFNKIISTLKISNQHLNTFKGADSYNPANKFTLNFPDSCKQAKQGSRDIMPGASNIICGDVFKIIPGAGAHGMGDNPQTYPRITTTTSEITLGNNSWTKTVYKNGDSLEDITTIYSNNGFLIEVNYPNYGYAENKNEHFVEEILSSFKFWKDFNSYSPTHKIGYKISFPADFENYSAFAGEGNYTPELSQNFGNNCDRIYIKNNTSSNNDFPGSKITFTNSKGIKFNEFVDNYSGKTTYYASTILGKNNFSITGNLGCSSKEVFDKALDTFEIVTK